MEDLTTMTNNGKFDIEELLKAIEEIRSEHYPHISKKVLEEIVRTELENQDDRASSSREVQAILDEYLKEVK